MNSLIVFAKPPLLGKVKTRLQAKIGAENALFIYQKLLLNCFEIANAVQAKTVFYWNEKSKEYSFPEKFNNKIQSGECIGDRMRNAIEDEIKLGASKVVLIGSDIPKISTSIINNAFNTLDSCDVVIGPAIDGGYYLIGLKQNHHQIFQLKSWSHADVLKETIYKANSQNLSVGFVDELSDLDTFNDLENFPELINLIKQE